MENEENILDLSDDDISYMSPDEAKGHINRAMRAGPEHPYYDPHHHDHRRTVEKVAKLYERKHADDPTGVQYDKDGEELLGQVDPRIQRICNEAMAEQAAKREKLRAEAQAEMDVLVNTHGYQRDDIPGDIQPWQVALLKAQRLNKSTPTPDTLRELHEILEKESYAVRRFDPKLMEAISHLSAARLTFGKDSAEEFSAIAERIIFSIDKAHDKMEAESERGTKKYHEKLLRKVIEKD